MGKKLIVNKGKRKSVIIIAREMVEKSLLKNIYSKPFQSASYTMERCVIMLSMAGFIL